MKERRQSPAQPSPLATRATSGPRREARPELPRDWGVGDPGPPRLLPGPQITGVKTEATLRKNTPRGPAWACVIITQPLPDSRVSGPYKDFKSAQPSGMWQGTERGRWDPAGRRPPG